MKFPNPCCRCGFCCLSVTCLVGQEVYGVKKETRCPGLLFENGEATCEIADAGNEDIIGVGYGCCIKARAIKDGVTYDFASLPPDLKKKVARDRI